MKIFVSLASYCDELLLFTIKDCISKASNPQNIYFGVVDQNEASQKEKLDTLNLGNQIRYVYVNNLETYGVCWARSIAFSLWDDEEYLLQVDSHTLFEQSWDSVLIAQHKKLKETSKKPIITTYPYGFEFDENNNPTFKPQSTKYVLVLRPKTELEKDDAVLRFHATHQLSENPVLGCHIAAGFIFTSSDFIQEVPYDPFLYFHGEEQSLAIRAYTRGWDIYHPNVIPVHHLYKQINADHLTHHWHKTVEDKRALGATYLRQRARNKVTRLLYGDGMINTPYGLGSERTMDEYIKFSGIDYKNRTITNKV